MKLNVKALTLLLSAGIIFSLSGCGREAVIVTPARWTSEVGYQMILADDTIEYVQIIQEILRIAPPSAAMQSIILV